jgi:EAL domain-containing protein (putative c-di-GMP-specific phosphodiesterase class I)
MDARMQARRALELDLRSAVAAGQFELYYQPIHQIDTGKIIGFEALIRWPHPERGMIAPGEFIPLAEEVGLITQLGEWVLRTACRDAVKWPGGIKVSVNLSPAQFRSAKLIDTVIGALNESKLPARRLELEITENVLLVETEATLAMLNHLHALGVQIAMDDFGTGYSSLSYFRNFHFDRIKIDSSFIRNIFDDASSLAIIRAVTGLSASLGMATTAEGVETKEQLDQLRAEGCIEVQGFLFSEPRPVSEIETLLASMAQRGEFAA